MKTKYALIFASFAAFVLLLTGCMGGAMPPRGWSGPVAINESIYVGAMDMKVVAMEVDRGYVKWRFPPETPLHYIYGDPVFYKDEVYVGAYNGRIYSFEIERGFYDLVYPADGSLGPIVGSPVISEGVLYIGSSDKKLYAINVSTRQLAWQPFETSDKIWSTPAVHDGTVYIGSFDGNMYALDAGSGNLLWTFATGGAIASTPIVHNDAVYFGSLDSTLYAVDTATGDLKQGFTPFKANNWFWGKAVVHNNSIIAACFDGNVYALDAESGARLWEAQTDGIIRGAPALMDNVVVVGTDEGSDRGRVYCFDADTGARLWVYPSEDAPPMFAIHASIGAGDGVVYVHAVNQNIYAIDIERGQYLWHRSTSGN